MRQIPIERLIPELFEAIADGSLDAHRDAIYERFRRRDSMQRMEKVAAFAPGDTVVFNDKVRPAYLKGVKATVVKVNQTSVSVRIDNPLQAGRYGGITKCPVNLVDKVPALV